MAKGNEVIDVALHLIDVANQKENLQHMDVEWFKALILFGVIDGAFDCGIKKTFNGRVEHIHGHQHADFLIGDCLGGVLKRVEQ